MKARIILGAVAVALLLTGCVTPEQRHVREYEARLKQTFGDYSSRYDRYSSAAPPVRKHQDSAAGERESNT